MASPETSERAGTRPLDLPIGGRSIGPGGLRARTARGTIINSSFLVGLNLLGLTKGFLVAAFLTREEFGIWGILVASLATLFILKQVGINDKFVQQDEEDQERAFQKAFTLECVVLGGMLVLLVAVVPAYAALHNEPRLIAPGLALALAVPAAALQMPLWVFYRDLDFLRQRLLQSIDPVVAFVVTVILAIAGFGYWSLVIGAIVGAWATAIASVLTCRYRIRFRWERASLGEYFQFSWPLFVGAIAGLAMAQIPVFAAKSLLGLAAVGTLALSLSLVVYIRRMDEIVLQTIYPAVCAAKDRGDVLREAFLKANRLGMLWAVPFGAGIALFVGDLITFGIGERWRDAEPVIAVLALAIVIDRLGYPWAAFQKAFGETRPIAVQSIVMAVGVCGIGIPMMAMHGLVGFAGALAGSVLVAVALRAFYIHRLFPGLPLLRNGLGSVLPTIPAAAFVLLVRSIEGGERTLGLALVELGGFVAVALAATALLERVLIREVLGYLRGRRRPATAPLG